jgi:hypothetical protein
MTKTLPYTEALAGLQACAPLAARLSATAGIYTELTAAELALLEQFATVVQSGWLEDGAAATALRRQAGLRPSDLGLLRGRLAQEQWRRDPAGVLLEVQAMLRGSRNRADRS